MTSENSSDTTTMTKRTTSLLMHVRDPNNRCSAIIHIALISSSILLPVCLFIVIEIILSDLQTRVFEPGLLTVSEGLDDDQVHRDVLPFVIIMIIAWSTVVLVRSAQLNVIFHQYGTKEDIWFKKMNIATTVFGVICPIMFALTYAFQYGRFSAMHLGFATMFFLTNLTYSALHGMLTFLETKFVRVRKGENATRLEILQFKAVVMCLITFVSFVCLVIFLIMTEFLLQQVPKYIGNSFEYLSLILSGVYFMCFAPLFFYHNPTGHLDLFAREWMHFFLNPNGKKAETIRSTLFENIEEAMGHIEVVTM